MSRVAWVSQNIAWLVLYYLLMDGFDTIIHLKEWDTSDKHPVTSLPLPKQLLYSLCVCITTYLGIVVPATLYSALFVSLGSSPAAWPPIFDRPFSATSLQDFWTHRWHHIFKRVFERLSLPIMLLVPKQLPLSVRRLVRAVVIFGLSAGFHLILIERLLSAPISQPSLTKDAQSGEPAGAGWVFLNPSTLKFFLLQPVGLFIERALLVPATSALPSAGSCFSTQNVGVGMVVAKRSPLGRFLGIWGGLWSQQEGLVGWSPIRGFLYGQYWTV